MLRLRVSGAAATAQQKEAELARQELDARRMLLERGVTSELEVNALARAVAKINGRYILRRKRAYLSYNQ